MKPAAYLTHGRFSIDSGDLPIQYHQQRNCLQQSLPNQLGDGQTTIFQLDQDLSFIDTQYTPANDLTILSKMDNHEPRIVVTLGLKGNSCFLGNVDSEVIFKAGFTTITSFNSSAGERQYDAQQSIRQLRLSIGKQWLDKYFGEIKSAQFFKKNNAKVISHKPISTQGIMSAQQLTNCNIAEELRLIYMHGQAMTLLAAELAHIFEDNNQYSGQYNQRDKAIAELARDILLDEFKNPPSVAELSKRAGTNQFKLKKLFHHFFNNTPYGLLFEHRMNHAYQLLESTHYQVAVVADLVGYNHASNFTTAFTTHFGISPKIVAKQN